MGRILKGAWHVITGGLAIAVGIATAPPVLNVFPGKTAGLIAAAGALLSALGIGHLATRD